MQIICFDALILNANFKLKQEVQVILLTSTKKVHQSRSPYVWCARCSTSFQGMLGPKYTWSRITQTRLYRIIAYFEGHLPHQKSLH